MLPLRLAQLFLTLFPDPLVPVDFANSTDAAHTAAMNVSFYLPVAMAAPLSGSEASYLFDIYYRPTPGVLDVIQNGTAGTSQIIESGLASDPTLVSPFSFAYVPVWGLPASGPPSLAGIVVVQFFWQALLLSSLTQALAGLDVTIQQENGASHSFSITSDPAPVGPVVNRGVGLRFDPGMGAYERRASTSVGLTWTFCIFPSRSYYDSFFTSEPLKLLVSVVAVVVGTCAMFVLYDALAERLRARLLRVAETVTRVVDDMLPRAVQDRVIAHLARTGGGGGDRDPAGGGTPVAGGGGDDARLIRWNLAPSEGSRNATPGGGRLWQGYTPSESSRSHSVGTVAAAYSQAPGGSASRLVAGAEPVHPWPGRPRPPSPPTGSSGPAGTGAGAPGVSGVRLQLLPSGGSVFEAEAEAVASDEGRLKSDREQLWWLERSESLKRQVVRLTGSPLVVSDAFADFHPSATVLVCHVGELASPRFLFVSCRGVWEEYLRSCSLHPLPVLVSLMVLL